MIIINDEKALRVVCEPVLPEEVSSLVEVLEKELANGNRLGRSGIGLAGPQISLAKHIAIIRLPNNSLNLVNAKIEKAHDPFVFKEEGCLSFPNKLIDTMRYQEVVVKNDVEPYHFVATGFLAVAIQHELDHLNSKLFMDAEVPKKTSIVVKAKLGPNELCSCNSGRKFKKCCGK